VPDRQELQFEPEIDPGKLGDSVIFQIKDYGEKSNQL
jgi:hypothetical protein